MIIAKIDVTKIDKAHMFKGNKGTYLDLVLMENRQGPDQYGNDGMVVQGVSKESRNAGIKGPIIGNYRVHNAHQAPAQASQPAPTKSKILPVEDDVPF